MIRVQTKKSGIIHAWTFDQTEFWVDKQGVQHRVAEIDPAYAANILLFLIRDARRFQRAYVLQTGPVRAPSESAVPWMLKRPLVTALANKVNER